MSFLTELRHEDLQRLRLVVRKVHMSYHPADLCTNAEADRIIEALGYRTAERMLKRAIDGRLVG